MFDPNLQAIALQFNNCINNRDVEGLARLMTDDHTFFDTEENIDRGKAQCLESWRGFFRQFPDYKNIHSTVTNRDNLVIMQGHSTCSDQRLDGPAIWTAQIRDGRVTEWRVYEDTTANRAKFGLG